MFHAPGYNAGFTAAPPDYRPYKPFSSQIFDYGTA